MDGATLAPAKVNLFLHVGPVDGDGYHPLASLVAFADLGDRLSVEPGEALALRVTGPFAAGLADEADNLVLRALRALGDVTGTGPPPLRVTLDKHLPLAAGLGGGSADAGAALRLARRALDLDLDDAALTQIAAGIGADGPMCLFARPVWAEGRGDVLEPAPDLPSLTTVLVNPGLPSPTGAVYRGYDAGPLATADRPAPPSSWTPAAVIDWLAGQRNDLQAPAVALCPAIGTTLAAVTAAPGVRLARMSGSGGTVFGLCEDAAAARAAAAALSAAHPHWWVQATVLGHGLQPDDH
ncbi:4-(cytidine 5'-diphospho)-2-C-methyl-D-erythritol kinase [uncultured Brevundimonas sp.]|uniref:4-(cytidine 5'-diphospho)-2-C-methyl-D-erythritol kinase n=1 Tax=uncultured Brevundimonas sp. TaxID=213418 RepID=UPI0030EC0F89|tara:strand:- start:3794 stop:4681 length:888 start_codon:yes stop_codon:yes gene_type:complete